MAILGVVCPRLQTRDAPGSLSSWPKQNDGAPGIDGVTFEAIEAEGVEAFLDQLREELVQRCYRPQRPRKVEYRRRAARCASFRFHPSGTGWSRER